MARFSVFLMMTARPSRSPWRRRRYPSISANPKASRCLFSRASVLPGGSVCGVARPAADTCSRSIQARPVPPMSTRCSSARLLRRTVPGAFFSSRTPALSPNQCSIEPAQLLQRRGAESSFTFICWRNRRTSALRRLTTCRRPRIRSLATQLGREPFEPGIVNAKRRQMRLGIQDIVGICAGLTA